MRIPNQVVPESKKTKSFLEQTVKAIVSQCGSSVSNKQKDFQLWQMYNEQYNVKEYDYLRKVGDYELPAKFRWIGVQRPRINLLASQQSKRPFVFSLVVGDNESKKQKIRNKSENLLKTIEMQILNKKVLLNLQIIELQQQVQQLEMFLQQEPQSEEQQAQQQAISLELPKVKMIINEQVQRLQQEALFSEKEIKDIDSYNRLTYREKKEMYAQVLMSKCIDKLDLINKSVDGFINKCTTGKEYFYVDYEEGQSLPTFEHVEDVKIYFPKIGSIDWVQDGPWVAIEDYMSLDQLLAKYSEDISEDEIAKLEALDYSNGDSNYSNVTAKDETLNTASIYSGTNVSSEKYRVVRIWFKSPRRIYIKKNPNPHEEGEYFKKFITEDESKKINRKKGEELIVRYVTDIYHGVYMPDLQRVICVHKKKYNRGYVDDWNKKDLPIYGPTFSRVSKQPYSLIKATEELQKLINILHYHRELMLAVAGTKGTIVDKSQVPRGMSVQEHQYQKKMGNLYIETVSKGGRKINSSFNQWTQYDETLSPAIQLIDNMIMNTDQMIGYMMGVGPQRMGQVVQGDQVGKTEMSIQQNALVTEILYYEHDFIYKKALEAMINLACKYCWNNGGIVTHNNPTVGEQIITIQKNLWKDVDLELIVENTTEEETALIGLKQVALNKMMANQMPFSNYVSLYRIKALKELEMKFRQFEEEAMDIAQQNQNSAIEQQAQLEEKRIQLEAEYKKISEEAKMQIEQMKLEMDNKKLEFESLKTQAELELRDKEMRSKAMTEMYKVDKDANVEMNYLAEQQRQAQMDEQLRASALKVDTMFKQIELQMAQTNQAYDKILKNKEIKVKEKGQILKSKEKIKD